MLTKEQLNIDDVSSLINKALDFLKSEELEADFENRFNDIKKELKTYRQLAHLLANYFVEATPPNNEKKVIELYYERKGNLSEKERKLLYGLSNSKDFIYEIKRQNKNGFELYNLVNEKIYNVHVLDRIVNYRTLTGGKFLQAIIFKYEDNYYLLDILNIFHSSQKTQALKLAVYMQMQKPELLYSDNQEKLSDIQELIKSMNSLFLKFFGKGEIITTSDCAAELLNRFNDYIETELYSPDTKNADVTEPNTNSVYDINLIKIPEKYKYFEIADPAYDPLNLENAAQRGFSSYGNVYDVGIIFDPESGLFVLPFYGTFKEIFKTEDYKLIDGYDDCIRNYLNSDKIPPYPILNVYAENNENFTRIVSEVMNIEKPVDIQEFLKKYKKDFMDERKFSSTTILYLSKSFTEFMELSAEQPNTETRMNIKIGRNDTCPCGSGKKFKKCCMNRG